MRRFTTLLAALLLLSSFAVYGQKGEMKDQENEIFFLQWLKPHNDKIQAFENALKEHNQKYHSGEHGVTVFYDISGKFHGHYELVAGPYTWTEYENRDMPEGHREHWINTVMPLVKNQAEPTAWKRLPEYELSPSGEVSGKYIITILTIKQGEDARFRETLKKWHKANKSAEDYDGSYNIYDRQVGSENQYAIVSYLEDGWAELDEQGNLRKRFENIHGKSAWDLWMEDVEEVIKSEEVVTRIHRPELSAGSENN